MARKFGWFIETEGRSLAGPMWFTEAGPFSTKAVASAWLEENADTLINNSPIRIILGNADGSE